MKRLLSALALSLAMPAAASAAILVDDGTAGLYNDGIGTALNGTDPFFVAPGAGDPTITLASAPDLAPAAAALGNWLSDPAAPGGAWSSGPVAIPSNWAVETETAIIYAIDGGTTGLTDVVASFGVDNGLAVWLNGTFVGGNQAPGGASSNEYSYTLGDLGAGTNYLQVLREDHGGGTGYTVEVTGDVAPIPLPAAGLLLAGALGAMGYGARRRRAAG